MTKPYLDTYRQDEASGVFVRPEIEVFAYSDGEEVESRILDIVRKAEDLSSLSEELEREATDWPSRYHLSRSRANLLRPYRDLIAGDVLEIGAGCGAITRFLGECGANVTAVEGSFRRAAVAAARVRDLKNVSVVCDRAQAFPAECKFDVVTLIGVLEYARMFSDSATAVEDLLHLVRSFLKPDGRLMLAIENRMGLKYFAGMPEDHVNHGMYGVEGLYGKRDPITFGRAELTRVLVGAGFGRVDFAYPFPDYKLPQSVVFDAAAALPATRFNAAAFAAESAGNDPQLRLPALFSLELTWQSIGSNELVGELANSFLVVASGQGDVPSSDPRHLAWHYSTGRARQFCKATLFERQDGDIVVRRMLLDAGGIPAEALPGAVKFEPLDEIYLPGETYRTDFARILARPMWHIDDVVRYFERYVVYLREQCGLEPPDASTSWAIALAPKALDMLPQNLICSDGRFRTIDQEWTAGGPVELGYVVFRALVYLLKALTRCGYPQNFSLTNFGIFAETVMTRILGDGAAERAAVYWGYEAALQKEVAGLAPVTGYSEWASGSMPILDPSTVSISGMLVEIQQLRGARAAWEELCVEAVERLSLPGASNESGIEPHPARLREAIGSYVSYEEGVIERQNAAIEDQGAAIDELRRAIDDAEARVEQGLRDREDVAARLAEANDALTSARQALAAMENSASWRWTRPMRQVSRLLRQLAGRGRG